MTMAPTPTPEFPPIQTPGPNQTPPGPPPGPETETGNAANTPDGGEALHETAEGFVEYLDWQDSIVERVLNRVEQANAEHGGQHANVDEPIHRASSFTAQDRARNGQGRRRGRINNPHHDFSSTYETDVAHPLDLGEINPDAEDGKTHGFVEFFVEEGTQLPSASPTYTLTPTRLSLPVR